MTASPIPDRETVLARARQLCDGPPAPQAELVETAKALMSYREWLDAAAVWKHARGAHTLERDPRIDTLSIAQQALCISKERADLSANDAFAQAVAVLEKGGLATTADQETLGIAGGIYKRYWDTFRQQEHLQQAFTYYDRGWDAGGIADDGYTGINCAYVADVLAHIEERVAKRGGAVSQTARQRREDATRYRKAIIREAPALEGRLAAAKAAASPDANQRSWWILVTLAEAHFGLGPHDSAHYSVASEYLRRAMDLPAVADWMVETTARQLGAMARMQAAAQPNTVGTDSRPWQVLDLLVKAVPGLRTELGGKVGLALSGGGFRASLFHIGVLARLAELDMLRHVEVISCVSGGSILGTAYYLKLRDLLEEKRDDEITTADYINIVADLEREFLRHIQQNNFRLRMLEGFGANLRMLKNRASRTEALGRVMGRELYGSETTSIDQITIQPPDGEPGLRPADYNWRRRNKVPLLVLNATNQAGGHPWQFTPYEMGEPQNSPVDVNPLMARRPYAGGNTPPHVWRAVSASACVPVLFEPVRVPFCGGHVDLLDGGVHDNQGSSALLDRDCTLLIVSDASGQLQNDANASTSFAAVGLRADIIVQERLRIALYEALEARRRGSLLRGMLFLHLRLGIGDRDDAPTPYGIPTGVQRRISAIRTDLDVFNDAEALSLMVSGYRMTSQQLPVQLTDVETPPPAEHPWEFRTFEDRVTATPARPKLLALLDLSGQRLLKVWRAVPALSWTGRVLVAAVALAALWFLIQLRQSDRAIQVSSIASTVLMTFGVMLVERVLRFKVPNWKKELAFVASALTGAGVARLHRKWLDPLYLRAGHRDRV